MKAGKIIKLIAKLAVITVIFYFLGRTVLSNWDSVKSYEWTFDPALMILSCLLYFTAYAALPWIWRKLMHYMSYDLSYGDAWEIFYIGNLGRYVPGKLWTIAGMAYMGKKAGIPATVAGTSAVFAQAYSMLSSFVFFVLFLIFNDTQYSTKKLVLLLPFFFIAAIVFIFPGNLERTLNAVLKRFGRNPVRLGITTLEAVKITACYVVSGVIYGLAFWIFILSIAGTGHVGAIFSISASNLAYWVGYLAFFVPGGLGVREGFLILLFSDILPGGVFIIIAGLSRLLVTLIELLCVILVFLRKGLFYGKKKTA